MSGQPLKYAIVGGGLAGLYCAYHLRHSIDAEGEIELFEAGHRLGGRIESWRIDPSDIRLDKDSQTPIAVEEMLKETRACDPEKNDILVAEFGPMRIEPDHQPYLKDLLKELKIEPGKPGSPKWSDLIAFPSYQGPPPDQPSFDLESEEAAQTTLIDLLLLALRRVFEVTSFLDLGEAERDDPWWIHRSWQCRAASEDFDYRSKKTGVPFEEANFYWKEFRKPTHLHRRFWKRSLMQWIMLLDEPDYQYIFDKAVFRQTPLKDLGFWNLLSAVLSHMATVKLRDWASFYHLLPENPSAAAWVIFWLRGIRTSNALRGIRGGMDFIVHRLCQKLDFTIVESETKTRHYPIYKNNPGERPKTPGDKSKGNRIKLSLGHKLLKVEQKKTAEGELVSELTFEGRNEPITVSGHVILALPKSALQRVIFVGQAKNINERLQALFDSVAVIPLLKCFFVVGDPFWPDNRAPNMYAHTTPTRELHYWKSRDKGTGLLMIYTDRPALQYWSDLNWPNPADKDDNEASGKDHLVLQNGITLRNRYQAHAKIWGWRDNGAYKKQVRKNEKFENDRLLRTFLLYAREEGAESITADRLLAAGMHDWSLRPYEAAAHAWRAGSPAGDIINYLSAFSLETDNAADDAKTLHICGEAYSDYQGFMEGALRSVALVLTKAPFHVPVSKLISDKQGERFRTVGGLRR
jgi:hypothetical protein